MFQISVQFDKNLGGDKLLLGMDERLTSFYKTYLIEITSYFTKQIRNRYSTVDEYEAKGIADNVVTALLSNSYVPRPEIGNIKSEKLVEEYHYSATVVKSFTRSSSEVDPKKTVLVVMPNKNNFTKVSAGAYILKQNGPWVMDKLPYLPTEKEATILYKKVSMDEVRRVRESNKAKMPKVKQLLLKQQIKVQPQFQKNIVENIKGIDDVTYWVLRKEFGIDARKIKVWIPSLEWIEKEGFMKPFVKDPNLLRILTDPNFNQYKNLVKPDIIVGKGDIEKTNNFIERIIK